MRGIRVQFEKCGTDAILFMADGGEGSGHFVVPYDLFMSLANGPVEVLLGDGRRKEIVVERDPGHAVATFRESAMPNRHRNNHRLNAR